MVAVVRETGKVTPVPGTCHPSRSHDQAGHSCSSLKEKTCLRRLVSGGVSKLVVGQHLGCPRWQPRSLSRLGGSPAPLHPRQARREPVWYGWLGKIILSTETMSDNNTGSRGWCRLKEHRRGESVGLGLRGRIKRQI